MTELENLRLKIDEIDKKITHLLEQRFDIAVEVVDYKRKNQLEILQSGREETVLKNVASLITNPAYKNAVNDIFIQLMNQSKNIQSKILETVELK